LGCGAGSSGDVRRDGDDVTLSILPPWDYLLALLKFVGFAI
jgi:hypothetical protein